MDLADTLKQNNWTSLASSALSGGLGLIGTGISNAISRSENQANREWNLMLAEKQNQWNIEQWNRENAYNLPVNQMKRLKEAGLNPDLMYSNGASGLVSANSPEMTAGASSNPATLQSWNLQEAYDNARLNSANVRYQNAKAEEQEIVNWELADRLGIEKETGEVELEKKRQELYEMKQSFADRMDNLKASTQSLLAKANADNAEAQYKVLLQSLEQQKWDEDKKRWEKEFNLKVRATDAEINKFVAECAYLEQQGKLSLEQSLKVAAERGLISKQDQIVAEEYLQLKWRNQNERNEYTYNKNERRAKAIIGMINDTLNAGANVISSFVPFTAKSNSSTNVRQSVTQSDGLGGSITTTTDTPYTRKKNGLWLPD